MRYRLLVLAAIAATGCTESPVEVTPVDLGAARVVIQSATAVPSDINEVRVTVGLKNMGGAGAFYVEFASPSNVPNQPGPTVNSETVNVVANYQETVVYLVPATSVSGVRIYSRAANSASYSRSDCYVVSTQAHC